MGEARRTIIVHAYDDKYEPCEVGFSMSGYGVRNDQIRCDKDKAKGGMKKSQPHVVVFELANRSSVDLQFPENPDVAMWVSDDHSTCLDQQPANPHPVIKAVSVSDDRQQLTVENLNCAKDNFKFVLNFERNDGKLCQYDPIWANQNGGQA
jgi:hypothetical protein